MKKLLITLLVIFGLVMSSVPSISAKGVSSKTKEKAESIEADEGEEAADSENAVNQADLFLETIGVLSAQSLYLTYTSIGTTADGYAKETYDKETATTLIKTYQGLAAGAKDQLNKLLSEDAVAEKEVEALNSIIEGFDLLDAEAAAYLNYIKTGNKKQLNTFTTKKEKAWAFISEFMGLKDSEE